MHLLTPLLIAALYGFIMWWFSAWRSAKALDANSTPLRDAQLAPFTSKMADALDVAHIPVHIYEVEPINGLAAPDGRIFITRGFYNKYREGEVSAQEISSVIAHELGHVALGHARRRMIDFSGQNALRVGLTMALSRLIPGIGVLIAQVLTRMMAAGLSRSDEYEADAYATALLIKSGIGAGPQISLFHKLDMLAGARGGVTAAWLMSHPKTPDRIKAIEANAAKWAG
ncbi:MAG: M48 family metallopeptidase [Maritimibacter sp.]